MNVKKGKRLVAFALAAVMTLAGIQWPAGEVQAAEIGDGSLASGYVKIEETKNTIAPGVSDKKIVMNTEDGNQQNIVFACEIDMSKETTGIMAGYRNYDGTEWGLQTTTQQAAKAEKATGENIVAAINADYFDMATGAPTGALVMDGTVYSQTNGRPYFAILKDGSAVIRDGSVPLDDVQEAVGGDPLIVKDGKFLISASDGGYDAIPYSRTAIGIKENGNVVTLVSHGRINPISYGMSMFDMAEILMGQGCKDVLILDGGGSSTYAAKYEGESKLQVVNNPSDGTERMVSSTLFITSSAKPTGVFDHASIIPNNTVYTPGSTVEFEATGVDSSGTKVDLPEGLTWQLKSDSADKGTIDENGVFTSNEATGEVTVELVQNGTVVGSTSITIAKPDSITFTNEELCLGFKDTSDLGLTVKYQGRTVNYKDGDFVWTLIPDDENAKAEDMGVFEGNMFTSSDGNSVNGTIKCESKWDSSVSGELYAIIGRLPQVVLDFEDETDEEGNVVTDAETYWLGDTDTETTGLITTKTYGRGGTEELSLVDVSTDEEYVRFGSKALKIDYDFTAATGTEGAGVGYTTNQKIEGTPTAVGMWVYAPEGTTNLWLRIRVNDADGQVQNLNFTEEISKSCSEAAAAGKNWDGDLSLLGGINWEGWHYVEAPLTDANGNALKAPFELRAGELIRVMYVPGTGMGYYQNDGTYVGAAERKGSIYIDNVRFVYGANVDDLDAPQAEFITLNEETLANGTTYNNNIVTIKASLYDVESAYMTGLDWDRIHTYVDGKEVTFEQAGEMLQISNLGLGNGDHTFKLVICDKFGNKTTETRNFSIKGDSEFATIEANIEAEGDVYLNSTQVYDFTTNYAEKINSFSADVQVNKLFGEDTLELVWNENVNGTSNYDAETGILHIEGTIKEGASVSGELKLAQLKCYIPTTTASGTKFRVSVSNGRYELKEEGTYSTTFSAKEYSAEVKETYSLSADVLSQGSTTGYIYVKDTDGNAISGADVYFEDGTKIGTTGSKGYVKANKVAVKEAGAYNLYAKKGDEYSFITKVNVLKSEGNEEGYPTQVTSVVTEDPSSQKAFTWFSNPDIADKTAIVQVATTAEYKENGEAAFENVTGSTVLHGFSSASAYINKVVLTGLKANVEYTYRVGDGNYWSDVNTFTLKKSGTDTNLFIIGDCQDENTTNVDKIMANLTSSGIAFNAGIQTGDLVDSGSSYSNWVAALNIFAKDKTISSTEILHAIGNHELEGDSKLTASQRIFNMPDANHYSVEYGNVYVATISYAFSESQLKEDLEWLIEDANNSSAQWKIVVTHQPAYYTNTAGSNELMNELLPAAAEEAGIDFVFSGHDHSYARTEPLTGGEVDEEGGIVYYICGSTGEKSYSISNNEAFHFACLNEDFEAIYLTIQATDEKMTVQTHELDGSIIDEYTKESDSECMKSGHTYVYDGSSYLSCEVCGNTKEVSGYTGAAKEKTSEKSMYFVNGKYQAGWFALEREVFYFDENGLAQKVELKKEVATECTVNGYKLYYCANASDADGKEYKVKDGLNAPGHMYDENRVCTVCGWEEASIQDCTISIKYSKYSYTGKEIKPTVTVKCNGKKLNSYYDYKVTYSDNIECGTATITINPKTHYWSNINENHGSLKWEEPRTITFTIRPKKVSNLKWTATGTNSVKLTWNSVLGAEGYKVYRYDSSTKKYVLVKTIKDPETTTITCTKNLKVGTRYTFKVLAYATSETDGETVTIKGAENKCYTATKPTRVTLSSVTAGTKSFTVKWGKKTCTGYEILYATNSSFTNAKKVTVSSASTVSKKITGLTKGKKYYVKVRAYKTTTDGKKVYGTYSKYKTVTAK